jgi:hypothetical protein
MYEELEEHMPFSLFINNTLSYGKKYLFLSNIYIYIILIPSVCVTALFLTLSHERNSSPVLLEPVWSEECPSKNNSPEKWPVAELPKEKYTQPMLFYGKNLAQFVFMFETQSYWESEIPNAGVTWIKWLITRT